MMLDRVDMSDTNNNITGLSSCPVFHWPQHSFLVEHFRDSRLPLSCELQAQLESLEIFSEEETTKTIDGKISSAARNCGLLARKKIWFTFDIFLSRNRPGLLTDPEQGIPKRKRKRRKKSKKGKAAEEEVTKDDISNSMIENILPIFEEELLVRAI